MSQPSNNNPPPPPPIPYVTATSFNVQSLCIATSTTSNRTKHNNTINEISTLARRNDLLALQETGCPPNTPPSTITRLIGAGGRTYSSNSGRPGPGGGVAIWASTATLKRYEVEQLQLPDIARGRLMALNLTPKDGGPKLLIINVHLHSGVLWNRKAAQLRLLTAHLARPSASDVTIALGDFNFLEREEDGPALHGGTNWSQAFRTALKHFKQFFRLHEVRQPEYTR